MSCSPRPGLGYSEGKANDDSGIGRFGNGVKTSTMRMGRDCLVTTRCGRSQTASAGLYSQSFLRATKQREIVIPIVTWRLSDGAPMGDAEDRGEALAALLEWSPFKTEKELLAHVMLSAGTYFPPTITTNVYRILYDQTVTNEKSECFKPLTTNHGSI